MWGLKWHHGLRIAALLVLLEQTAEAGFAGTSLAEHPALMIAALGALGMPIPNGNGKK